MRTEQEEKELIERLDKSPYMQAFFLKQEREEDQIKLFCSLQKP